MTSPSVKKLMEELKLSKQDATEIKALMVAAETKDEIEACLERAAVLMGHGGDVQGVFYGGRCWPDISYVNTGESYGATLYYDYYDRDKFCVGSWAGYVEYMQAHGRQYP